MDRVKWNEMKIHYITTKKMREEREFKIFLLIPSSGELVD